MSIKQRLYTAFILVILGMAIIGSSALLGTNYIRQQYQARINENGVKFGQLSRIHLNTLKLQLFSAKYALAHHQAQAFITTETKPAWAARSLINAHDQDFFLILNNLDQSMSAYKNTLSVDEIPIVNELDNTLNTLVHLNQQAINTDQGTQPTVLSIYHPQNTEFIENKVEFLLAQAVDLNRKDLATDIERLNNRVLQLTGFILSLCLLIILSSIYLARHIVHSIAYPIRRLKNAAHRISGGHFNEKTELNRPDELGSLANTFNKMAHNLKERKESLENFYQQLQDAVDEKTRLYQQAQLEISERKKAEEKMLKALQAKNTLLKEIHHRVKNNMQIISSLLHLQSKSITDVNLLSLFKDAQHRIHSMALVNEKLYRSHDVAQIDLAHYVADLTNYLFQSYGVSNSHINYHIKHDTIYLNLDTAIPCGLIINELLSNALKYAFIHQDHGLITITLKQFRSCICICVADDGIGLPKHLDLEHTQSLGLRLVQNLVKQLGGTLSVGTTSGALFRVKFSLMT